MLHCRNRLYLALLLILLAFPGCVAPPQEPAAEAVPAAAETTPPPETPAETPARPVPGPEIRQRLADWWLRHDQSYMLVLDSLAEDGQVVARYLNPEPVHVSRAESWIEAGVVRLLVELTDENYPGSYYELAYMADRDVWVGVYHHLGVGETYEVYFTRFEGERPE